MSRLQWNPVQATGAFSPVDALDTAGKMLGRASKETQQLNENSLINDGIINQTNDKRIANLERELGIDFEREAKSAAIRAAFNPKSSSTGKAEIGPDRLNELINMASSGIPAKDVGFNSQDELKIYRDTVADLSKTQDAELEVATGNINAQKDQELAAIDSMGLSPEYAEQAKTAVNNKYSQMLSEYTNEHTASGKRFTNNLPTGISGDRTGGIDVGKVTPKIGAYDSKVGDRYQKVKPFIENAASKFNMDPNELTGLIYLESTFKPNASVADGSTSAKGLGQHVSDTWKEMVDKHGDMIEGEPDPNNPEHSALMSAAYFAHNNERFVKAKGREPSVVESYAMYNLGYAGSKKFLDADDNQKINSSIIKQSFIDNNGGLYSGKTVGEAKEEILRRLMTGSQYRSEEPTVSADTPLAEFTDGPVVSVPNADTPLETDPMERIEQVAANTTADPDVPLVDPETGNVIMPPNEEIYSPREEYIDDSLFKRRARHNWDNRPSGVLEQIAHDVKGAGLLAMDILFKDNGEPIKDIEAIAKSSPEATNDVAEAIKSTPTKQEDVTPVVVTPEGINKAKTSWEVRKIQMEELNKSSSPITEDEYYGSLKDVKELTGVPIETLNKTGMELQKKHNLSYSEILSVLRRAGTQTSTFFGGSKFTDAGLDAAVKSVKNTRQGNELQREAITRIGSQFNESSASAEMIKEKIDKLLRDIEKVSGRPYIQPNVINNMENRLREYTVNLNKELSRMGEALTESDRILAGSK